MDGGHWKGVAAIVAVLAVVGVTALPSVDNDLTAVAEDVSDLTPIEREGKRVYEKYCVGCHGAQGDGNGVSAKWLEIKPRDFRSGVLRFAAVEYGGAPRIEDYVRAIRHGLTGSAMPAWTEMPDDEVLAVSHYVRTFAQNRRPPGRPVVLFEDPFWAQDPLTFAQNAKRAIEQGRKVYHSQAKCMECHPSYHRSMEEWNYLTYDPKFNTYGSLRDNPNEAAPKNDEYTKVPLMPPDFTHGPIKAGGDLETLARSIGAGLGGALMPSWAKLFRSSGKHYARFDGSMEDLAQFIAEEEVGEDWDDFIEYTYEDDGDIILEFANALDQKYAEIGAKKFWALVYYIHALIPNKFGGASETPLLGDLTWGDVATPPLTITEDGKEVPGYETPDTWED